STTLAVRLEHEGDHSGAGRGAVDGLPLPVRSRMDTARSHREAPRVSQVQKPELGSPQALRTEAEVGLAWRPATPILTNRAAGRLPPRPIWGNVGCRQLPMIGAHTRPSL